MTIEVDLKEIELLFSEVKSKLDSLLEEKDTCVLMALGKEDRKILFETKEKLDEAAELMNELIETIEVLKDPEMVKSIHQSQEDIKAGRVKELRTFLKEDAF